MSFGKILAMTSLLLLIFIGGAALFKESNLPEQHLVKVDEAIEIELEEEAAPKVVKMEALSPSIASQIEPPIEPKEALVVNDLPDADRIDELFHTKGPKLPIVETITYKSRVSWQKGRPAWLSDYASHYNTSRHFIARSLNGKPDYMKQEIAEGDKFNVLVQDRPLEFHLVVDASRCKMWFYALDGENKTKILLKTYPVSLGRPDNSKTSRSLTPLGKYSLGSRIAVYKPGVMGNHKGKKVEMIQVFGSRWIPFEKEIANTTAPAKGFGIHGVPWVKNSKGALEQDVSSLGHYESDGCIRMKSEDIEEVFAIVITKPTSIEIVKDFSASELAK